MMVKVSKPKQDLRFDVQVIGPATIETASEAGVNAIVIEAGSTLLLGREEVFRFCEAKKISLLPLAQRVDEAWSLIFMRKDYLELPEG